MDFSETVILIGHTAVTWGHLSVLAAALALILLVTAVILAWRAATLSFLKGNGQPLIPFTRRRAPFHVMPFLTISTTHVTKITRTPSS